MSGHERDYIVDPEFLPCPEDFGYTVGVSAWSELERQLGEKLSPGNEEGVEQFLSVAGEMIGDGCPGDSGELFAVVEDESFFWSGVTSDGTT